MLNSLIKYISDTKSFKDYAAKRIIMDSTMLTITHEYVKSLTNDSKEEIVDDIHKKSIEVTELRNSFCNRHIIYTKVFDYIFKKGLEEKS